MQSLHRARMNAPPLKRLLLLFCFLIQPLNSTPAAAQQGRAAPPPVMSSGGVGTTPTSQTNNSGAGKLSSPGYRDARDWSASSRRQSPPTTSQQPPFPNTPAPGPYPSQQPSTVTRMQNRVAQNQSVQSPGQAIPSGKVSFASATEPIDTQQAATKGDSIKLRPKSSDAESGASKPRSGLESLVTIGSSLLLVIGLFLGAAWIYRKAMNPSGTTGMPKEVVQVLGQTLIGSRQQLMLLRFGPKLVLVSVVQGESRTISEITDPVEVDRISGICESKQPGSISESFRSILAQGGAQ